MAPQFLGLTTISFCASVYLIRQRKSLSLSMSLVLSHQLTQLIGIYLLWCVLTLVVSVNRIESLLVLGRMVAVFIIYLLVSIFSVGVKERFERMLVAIFMLVSFLESGYVIFEFISRVGKEPISLLIYSLKGTAGNKNVLAASIAIKIPFILLVYQSEEKFKKYISSLLIVFSSLALFLINARAAILSLIIIAVIFSAYMIFNQYQTGKIKNTIKQVGLFWCLLATALFFSQVLLSTGLMDSEGSKVKTSYGTVVDRMSHLEISNQSSSNRIRMWKDACNYISHHYWMGSGIGNWKIESIPYTSLVANDLYVPYHAHNDFLEGAAETGLPGLFFYVAIFVFAIWQLIKKLKNPKSYEKSRYAMALFLAMVVYSVDAFFNFPSERPVMQLLFCLLLVAVLNLSGEDKLHKTPGRVHWRGVLFMSLLLFQIPILVYGIKYFQSMKAQAKMLSEYDREPAFSTNEIREDLGQSGFFPTISAQFALPIGSLLARYEIRDGNYDEAVRLINHASASNPHIYYNEFLLGYIYLKQKKYDSAIQYTSISFHHRPRCKPYFKNHLTAALMVRDSMEIEKTFKTYLQNRNEPYAWELYLGAIYEWRGKATPDLLSKTDSLLKVFPGDAGLNNLYTTMLGTGGKAAQDSNKQKSIQADALRKKAEQYFSQQQYEQASVYFQQAFEKMPGDLSLAENAGLCEYAASHFEKSMSFFDHVLKNDGLPGGKSAFFKALSLIQLHKTEQACLLFSIALKQGYDPAQIGQYQQKYCESH